MAPVYPPIQRMIFSEWHFGQNRFVTTGLTKEAVLPVRCFGGPLPPFKKRKGGVRVAILVSELV